MGIRTELQHPLELCHCGLLITLSVLALLFVSARQVCVLFIFCEGMFKCVLWLKQNAIKRPNCLFYGDILLFSRDKT